MNETTTARPRWAIAASLLAVAFGIATIVAGGKMLFGGPAARAAAGNIVPFVLLFNFMAGFAYVIAGCGIFLWRRWAAPLSAIIAAATVAVFVAFGLHVVLGGMFEARTIAAMTARSLFWIVIAAALYRSLLGLPNRKKRTS